MTTKRWAQWVVVASSMWLLAADAGAQGPYRQPQGGNANAGSPQRMMPAMRPEPASARNEAASDSGRLSPEERRQLRRDVHDAGRDLYSDRVPPGRREGRRP